MSIPVYLEVGTKRVFAGAVEWPGWCRSGRDEDAALEALVAYAPRYAAAIGKAGRGFKAPKTLDELEVVERLKGDAATDFGAPGIPPAADDRPLSGKELERQLLILKASWDAVDRAAKGAKSKVLRKGPRGGGRGTEAIRTHVVDADGAYLRSMGGRLGDGDLYDTFVDTIRARARGEPPPPSPRRKKPPWTPRYAVRRSAWHALDHAWEIEDRSEH